MALPQGIAFRDTDAYVTDGANDFCENGTVNTPSYPTTSTQGNTVGWETLGTSMIGVNVNTGYDARLAGYAYSNNGYSKCTYRIDLPSSGNYNVRSACGDAGYNQRWATLEAFDTNSSLGTLSSGQNSAGYVFADANDAEYSVANWPGSNTAKALTYSTTIARFTLGTDVAGQVYHQISYLYIESAGGGATGQPTMRRRGGVPGTTSGPKSFGRGW